MPQPPLLPAETLARVLRFARFDGIGVLVLGSVFALMAATDRQIPFVLIGMLAAGAGSVELHGVALLRRGEPRGLAWLVASQPFLLLVILGYCVVRGWFTEIPPLPEEIQPMLKASAEQMGMTVDAYLHLLNRVTVTVVALVAIGFQGGVTLYYWRRRGAIEQALSEESD